MPSLPWHLLLVGALALATMASGAWCAAALVPERVRAWWRAGARPRLGAVALLPVLVLAAAARVLLVPAHHAMYLDEPWYAEAACNLARDGRVEVCEETWAGPRCTRFEKAWGWPVLLAPWVALAGCASTAGIPVNRVLGTATVLLVALAVRCAGGRWWQAAVAAAIAALHPVHVVWSSTGETNVAAAAALLAGLCGALIYLRAGEPRAARRAGADGAAPSTASGACGAALAVSSLGLATAIRPELLAPALAAAAVLGLTASDAPARRVRVAAAIAVACGAAAAAGVQLWSMNEEISGGAFLSLANLARALASLAEPPTLLVHGAVAVLGLVGAIALARWRGVPVAALLLGTALAAALVVMAYERFHGRMLLAATAALLPLTGFAFGRGRIGPSAGLLAVGGLALLWRASLLSPDVPSETQSLETRIAASVERLALEPGALFIAQQPAVLAAGGLRPVMSVKEALADADRLSGVVRSGRPVYFLRDMYCEVRFEGGADAPACERLLARFATTAVTAESRFGRTYTLYRLSAPP